MAGPVTIKCIIADTRASPCEYCSPVTSVQSRKSGCCLPQSLLLRYKDRTFKKKRGRPPFFFFFSSSSSCEMPEHIQTQTCCLNWVRLFFVLLFVVLSCLMSREKQNSRGGIMEWKHERTLNEVNHVNLLGNLCGFQMEIL